MKIDHVGIAKQRLARLEKERDEKAAVIKSYTDQLNELEGEIQACEMFLSTAAELEGLPWSDDAEQPA